MLGGIAMLRQKKQKSKGTDKKQFETPDYQDFLHDKIGISELDEVPVCEEEVSQKLNIIFEHSSDFEHRTVILPSKQTLTVYYFDGIIHHERLQEGVIQPFVLRVEKQIEDEVKELGEVIYNVKYTTPANWRELLDNCLKGDVICHLSGVKPITVALPNFETRSLSEPSTEQQVYGPKVGFVEDAVRNLSMLRKYFKDPRLKARNYKLGSLSQTNALVVYLDEYVDNDLLYDVLERISNVKTDNVSTTAILAQHITEFPKSLFPQVKKTERPDQAAFALTQGKIVILLDNSTFGIVLPSTLASFYETGDDNDEGSVWSVTFIRLIRMLSMFVATLLPALYVALVAFHPELIPTTLALTIAESRNNIPFPAAIEAFLMMFALDTLVESSIRLPSFIGQTIGIVGGLVIGQAAVEAGIVSSVMVIVIAFTAISAFTAPSWELASSWRIVRYILLLFASILGLFGVVLGVCLLTIHVCALTSFKKPYMSPLSPLNPKELLNIFGRTSLREKDVGGTNQYENRKENS